MNSNDREIELVEIVFRFLFHRGGKMIFDICLVSLCTREPAGDDVISGLVAVVRRNMFERFPRDIELTEAQRS